MTVTSMILPSVAITVSTPSWGGEIPYVSAPGFKDAFSLFSPAAWQVQNLGIISTVTKKWSLFTDGTFNPTMTMLSLQDF